MGSFGGYVTKEGVPKGASSFHTKIANGLEIGKIRARCPLLYDIIEYAKTI